MPVRRETFHIDAHELVGERLRVDGFLSRTGIQIYSDGMGGKRREFRDPEEVFNEDSLASFRAMPITIQHPQGMVTASTWRKDAVGNVGDDPHKSDDGKHVAASLWVHDADAITRVKSGDLTELSVGYLAALDETPGTTPEGEHFDARQVDIRGNHVALLHLGQARGGRTVRLRLDSAGDAILAEDRPEEEMKIKIKIDGLTYEVDADDNFAKALEKERADAEEILAQAETTKSEAEARADAAEAKLQILEDASKVQALESVKADALKIAPKLEISKDDTAEQIRRNALDATGIKTDSKDDTYVQVRFDMALETPKETPVDRVRRAVHDTTVEEGFEPFSIDAAARGMRS